MAPTPIRCATCGAENLPTAYFCASCGIGLELLLPPGCDELVNVPVGILVRRSLAWGLGSVAGIMLLGRLISTQAMHLSHWGVKVYPLLTSLLLWKGGPVAFGLGSWLGMGTAARKVGLKVDWRRLLGGALAGVAVAEGLGFVSQEIGLLAAFLVTPFLAARFGLGFMTPWYPVKKLLGYAVVLGAVVVGGIAYKQAEKGWSLSGVSAMAMAPGKGSDLTMLFLKDGSVTIGKNGVKTHLEARKCWEVRSNLGNETTPWAESLGVGRGEVLSVEEVGAKFFWKKLLPGGPYLTAAQKGNEVVVAGLRDLEYSQDGALHWQQIKVNPPFPEVVIRMAIDAKGRWWVCTLKGAVYYSDTKGASFALFREMGTIIDILPAGGMLGFLTPQGVLLTEDEGRSWETVAPPDNRVFCQAAAFEEATGRWAVAVKNRVWILAGKTWEGTSPLDGVFWVGFDEAGKLHAGNVEGSYCWEGKVWREEAAP